MTSPQHKSGPTPGPWHRNIPPASKYPVIFAGRNTHVAQVCVRGLPESEIEANCDLIAAAPDLYKALAIARSYVAAADNGAEWGGLLADAQETRANLEIIDAVLSAARAQKEGE